MEHNSSKSTTIDWLIRILSAVVSITVMVSSWTLKQAWDRIDNIDNQVHQLELKGAETAGNRFTSVDWMREKSLIDAKELEREKRFSIIESDLRFIKEGIQDIKKQLDTK